MKGILPRTVSGTFHLVVLILVVPLVLAIAAGGADRESIQAVHDAAGAGDVEALKALLEEDEGLLEARNAGGGTPLHTASQAGMLDVVEFLASRGADVEAGDNENTPPLQVASLGGHIDVVEFLIAEGADPLSADDFGMTALHWAAYNNHVNIAELMLGLGAPLDAQKANGSTPLHGAAYGGHSDMVELLVAGGAELDIQNEFGYTPLLSALSRGHVGIAEFLIDKGADMNVWADWQSALHLAAVSGNIEAVELVISKGVDVNARLENSVTAMIPAIWSENIEIITLLLDKGTDVNESSSGGYTLLHRTVTQGNREIVEEFIRRGAGVNAETEQGISPLDLAVSEGNAEIAGILIKAGAKVNDKDPYFGRTPLHVASAYGNTALTGLLLANGSSMNEKDEEGCTALDLAARYGHRDVAGLLEAKGARAGRKVENYGYCGLLGKTLDEGEALLWYTGHCGWAIKTRNHFLVFDYFNRGADPASPCLANGHINAEEIGDLDVTVFVTHEHGDHFDTTIFDWESQVDRITYVYGFRPEDLPQYRQARYNGPDYEYVGPRESATVGSLKISTIRANDAGVGFLVEVDGITLYHAGDHAGWAEGEKQGYLDEIDYLADIAGNIDMAFLNVTGCHAHNPDALREGTYYTIDKLSPRVVIPTHAGTREHAYAEAVEKAAEDGIKTAYVCPMCRGDRFVYNDGAMRQDVRESSS